MQSNAVESWLEKFVRATGGCRGTVHERADDGTLVLIAAWNVKPLVRGALGRIARGQGTAAALAAERGAAISTAGRRITGTFKFAPRPADLDLDEPGTVVALPVLVDGEDVRAVVSVLFEAGLSVTDAELVGMLEQAQGLDLGSDVTPHPGAVGDEALLS